MKFLHFHLVGTQSRTNTTACENAIKILHSREGRFCNNFGQWSPQGEMHMKMFIPLAGIRSRTDKSACRNAIKILHPCRRRFCNYYGSQSPRAEMHMKIYIPPLRQYDPEPIVPLAEMQSKYCIPTSRYSVIVSVHGPSRAEMHIKIDILPLWEYDSEPTVPLAVMQSKFWFPASGGLYYFSSYPRLRKYT